MLPISQGSSGIYKLPTYCCVREYQITQTLHFTINKKNYKKKQIGGKDYKKEYGIISYNMEENKMNK